MLQGGLDFQLRLGEILRDFIMKEDSESVMPESDKWADQAGMTNRAERNKDREVQ